MAILTEDEIDEILYFARANEIEDLKTYIPTLFPKYGTQPAWILSQAVDAETGNTSLHYAGANGHIDMVNYLLSLFPSSSADRKPFINKQNNSGNTALHWSSLNGHMSVVKALLAAGADASILNNSGHDAVYEAEMNDKQEVAEYLLKEALGLEKAIGREGDGRSPDEEDEEVEGGEGEGDGDADKVADGMAEMDLKSSTPKGDMG
ncbi:uncharacterized protein PV09_02088 [Verruconis gallopava]|uniref:Uncharacterized protein n=1 Tax=Verruconis gallopava TaxID=253628 RepID=A0A0D1XWQ6_9PEZI|nr:uncharacterized protein PV09_02088 [Verruconis gallopava]KIW07231.1 hypothetical protein PV09_02088 [Verruconis gallopava]